MHSEILFDFLIVFFLILSLKNMLQTLKISVSCRRNAYFHKIACFDADHGFDQKTFQNSVELHQKSIKKAFLM